MKTRSLVAMLIAGAAAAGAAGIGLVSTGAAATTQVQEVRPASRFDGQTIFRGIFLHVGPVAELVPVVAGLPPTPPGLEEESSLLMEAISATDPAFFDRYAAQMQSGDPLLVQQATEQAGRLITEITGADGALTRMRPREDNYSHVDFYRYVFRVMWAYEYLWLFQHGAIYQRLWWPNRDLLPRSAIERDVAVARVTQALAG